MGAEMTTTAAIAPTYKFGPQGLVLAQAITSNGDYEAIGRRIGQIGQSLKWALGDWLVYGRDHGFKAAHYDLAQEITGMSFDVLSQTQRVAAAFPSDFRVPGLSWTHHRAALPLPTGERLAVLHRAAHEHWTAAMLNAFVVDRHAATERGLAVAALPSPAREAPHLRTRLLGWRRAAPRQRTIRVCPKCGHRWQPQTTAIARPSH